MKNREPGMCVSGMRVSVRTFGMFVLVFYTMMLVLQSAAISLAAETLEGKIAGTGHKKVWLNIGSAQGVAEGMMFEIKRAETVIAKVKITKVSKSSSEAEVVELLTENDCAAGDSAAMLAAPVTETKKEEPKVEKPVETPKTEQPAEVKKDTPPATAVVTTPPATTPATPAETKKDTPNAETKKAASKKKGFKFSKRIWLYVAVIGAYALTQATKGKSGDGGKPPVDFIGGVPGQEDLPSPGGIPGF